MLGKYRYGGGRRTTAILPSRSRIHPLHPERNEFHAGWGDSAGTYLLLEKEIGSGKSYLILSGSGSPEGYPNVGDTIEAHHDQTFSYIGRLRVIAKTTHAEIGDMPVKKALPLYVYK